MPLLHVLEQRFSSAQNDGIDHQLKLINQAEIHQTGHQCCAADGVDVLPGLLFQIPDFFGVANDPRRLPRDLIQRPGKNDVGRLIGPARKAISFLVAGVPLNGKLPVGLASTTSQYCS